MAMVSQEQSQATAATSGVGQVTYKLDDKVLERAAKKTALAEVKMVSLLGYDEKLLKKDLFKTLVLTFVVFGLEIGLWMYLK